MQQNEKIALFICLTGLLFGGVAVGCGYVMSEDMRQLHTDAIETTAVVTRLTTVQMRSGNSRSNTYRVFMDVEANGRNLTLVDDVLEQPGNRTAKGKCSSAQSSLRSA